MVSKYEKLTYCLFGFCLCFIMVACGAATFPFHYYELDYTNGNLRGPANDGSKDLNERATCSPTGAIAYPCTVMLEAEFFALKKDDLDCHTKLDALQNPPPSN